MKTTKIFSGIAIFLLSLILHSCKKDQVSSELDNESINNEAVSAFVEKSISSDEDAPSMKGASSNAGSSNIGCNWQELLPSCAVVTESGAEFPKTITIDYGSGCVNANGITKSGIVIITLTADMMTEGAVRTVTFNNYVVNNSQITGSRTTTNTGTNDSGHPVFHRSVNTTITRNGNTFSRVANEDITWLSGYDTEDCGDNILSVTGSGTCTRADGVSRTRTIVQPLIIDHSCGYITQGIVQITGPHGVGTINFGDGSCDDLAMVTRPNGNTEQIHLHQN